MSTVVITGANRGIGLEMAKQAAAAGDTVIAVCREPSSALAEAGVRIESGIDVTSAQNVTDLAGRLANEQIDLLVNNAGVLAHEGLASLDFDSIRHQFEVNSLGPLRVTAALVPRMVEGSKVAIITSRMGSIDDNTSGGAYGYRMSKCAVNMAAMSLSHDLRGQGIAVGVFHPGFVRTQMTGGNGNVEPSESAALLRERFAELDLDHTGCFVHANGEPLPW